MSAVLPQLSRCSWSLAGTNASSRGGESGTWRQHHGYLQNRAGVACGAPKRQTVTFGLQYIDQHTILYRYGHTSSASTERVWLCAHHKAGLPIAICQTRLVLLFQHRRFLPTGYRSAGTISIDRPSLSYWRTRRIAVQSLALASPH